MSAEIIELDVITKLDLDASEILSEIAKEDPKHVFLVVWPKDGGHPTFHASTSDTPVVLYQLERFKHFIFSEDCDDAEGGHADPRPTSQTGSRRRAVPLLRSGEPVR
jgi:hypothetical protein